MNRQSVIEKFIYELKNKKDILGIILFGSRATDVYREASDVDLLVIQKEGFERKVEFLDPLAFEITYTTSEQVLDYWKNNPNDCYWLWKNGEVLFDFDGTVQKLEEKAQKIIDKGKKTLSTKQIEHLLFDANDQIEAVKNLKKEDIYTANLVLTRKVYKLTELYFDIRQKWTPPPKQIIIEVNEISIELADMIKKFYEPDKDFDKKIELAEKITNIVFDNNY